MGLIQQYAAPPNATTDQDLQDDAAISAALGQQPVAPPPPPIAPHPFVPPTPAQMAALNGAGPMPPAQPATPAQAAMQASAIQAAAQSRGGAEPLVPPPKPFAKPSVWDDPSGLQAALAKGDANPITAQPTPWQMDTRGVIGYPQASGASAPAASKPSSSRIAQYAKGPSGSPFDPFANQKAAAEGGERDLSKRATMMDAAAGDRQTALDAASQHDRDYADQVKKDNEAAESERASILANHKSLVQGEAARDYTAEFFRQKGAIGHVADLIGAAAGGFLQGFRGLATNPYFDQQNKQIDRYIANAQHNSALKIGESKDLYSHFLEKTQSKEAASALVHRSILSADAAQIQKAANETEDLDRRGRLADAYQQVKAQVAQWDDAAIVAQRRAIAAAAAANNPLTLAKEEQALRKTEAEIGKIKAEAAKTQGEADAGPGGKGTGTLVNLPDGTQAHATSPDAAADYTQRMMGADKFDRAITELQAIREKHGGGTFSPSDRKLAEGLAAEAKTAYVQMNGFKRTPNETEFHALDKIVPSDAGEFSFSTDEQLTQARMLAKQARDQAAAAHLVPTAPTAASSSRIRAAAQPPIPGLQRVGAT